MFGKQRSAKETRKFEILPFRFAVLRGTDFRSVAFAMFTICSRSSVSESDSSKNVDRVILEEISFELF